MNNLDPNKEFLNFATISQKMYYLDQNFWNFHFVYLHNFLHYIQNCKYIFPGLYHKFHYMNNLDPNIKFLNILVIWQKSLLNINFKKKVFIFLPSQFSPLYPEKQIHFPKVVSHFPLYEQFGSKHKISEFISDLTKILTKYQLILFTFTIFSPVSRIANTFSQGYITFSIIWTIWIHT